MDYEAALAYLDDLVSYEKRGFSRHFADALKLDMIQRMAELLGNPQDKLASVHIAGTKGKGSVAATVESIARAAGYRTGLFTSPHLLSPRERLRINGEMVPREDMAQLVAAIKPVVEEVDADEGLSPPGLRPPSFFEVYTAMAFQYFAEQNVDLAIFEVGLGGRLDATNIIKPLVCAITTLGLDHTDVLGETIEEIAGEKAGIIKPGVPVVVAPNPREATDVIRQQATVQGAEMIPAPDASIVAPGSSLATPDSGEELPRPLQTVAFQTSDGVRWEVSSPLIGKHQAVNVGVAVEVAQALREAGFDDIDAEAVCDGVRDVAWPARLEIVAMRPWVVLDCAHNAESMRALADTLPDLVEYEQLVVVLGLSEDKDAAAIAEIIAPLADIAVLTQAQIPRAMSVEDLAAATENYWRQCRTASTIGEATAAAFELAGPRDCIVITGSFFVLEEYLQLASEASR